VAAETVTRITKKPNACFNAQDLISGRVILLLDALDEVTSDDGRASVLRRAKEFNQAYKKCPVVITSRKQEFLKESGDILAFTTYDLSPFSLEQAHRLVLRITQSIHHQTLDTNEILRRIQDVHGVGLSPLLVTILVATSDFNRQDMPANITELFKKYTEMMLGRWDKQKGLSQQIHAPLKDFLLCSLGFELHKQRRVAMPLTECRTLFENELSSRGHDADIQALFDEIVFRSSLVRIIGDDIEFRHLLIQEFFAGRGIPSVDFLNGVVGDRWWAKPIVFYFGENPADSAAILKVIGGLTESDPYKLYAAAAAIGLATQACYLSKVKDKLTAIQWVVQTFASLKEPFLQGFNRAIGNDESTAVFS
jgi:hypothetical protein